MFIAGCAEHPSAAWVTQQARNLTWYLDEADRRPAILIDDQDAKCPAAFDAVFRAKAVRVVRTLVQAPRANYVDHYNMARPHRALELQAPLARGQPAQPTGRAEQIVRRDRLGGLIHEYEPVLA